MPKEKGETPKWTGRTWGDWGGRRSGGQTGSAPLRLGRSGEAGGWGPLGGVAEERRAFALPPRAQEACWAPRWGPLPSETRVGGHTWALPVLLSLSPTPHRPQDLFQPCGSWALASSTTQTSTLLRLRAPQPRLSLPLFFFFFSLLLFFTIVVLLYLLVVDSSIFLFLYYF